MREQCLACHHLTHDVLSYSFAYESKVLCCSADFLTNSPCCSLARNIDADCTVDPKLPDAHTSSPQKANY